MKKQLFTLLFILPLLGLHAQDFPGYRAGNYTGVNGVFFNPANIADSRYRFDINLVSVGTFVGNDQASFKLRSVVRSFDSDSLQNRLFGTNPGPSSGIVHADIHGPSVMFNAGPKSSFAVTTRARTMANIVDLDGRLAQQLIDDLDSDVQLPYSISSNQDMRFTVNSWTEFGASFARILSDRGAHFVKAGLTLKYLAGVANGYIQINNLTGTLNEEAITGNPYLSGTTGRVAAGFGGLAVSDFELNNGFEMKSSGFGGDIGAVYEYRPDYTAGSVASRHLNKYKVKVGIALLDIGKIKYSTDPARSGGFDISITGSERFYLDELDNTDVDDFDSFFRSKPQFFSPLPAPDGDYKVSLPSTLQLDVDYHLTKEYFANLALQIPVADKSPFNGRYYSSITLTPRYEGRIVGVYVPINHNSLTKFNAGVSLRVGPLFVGSGSVLSAAIDRSKQADLHVGLRFGRLHKAN